jgi:hypothetical protein
VPPPPGSVSGTVFYDANRNAVYDSCDRPLSNVAVVATAAGGETRSATAGSEGAFRIEEVPPGETSVALNVAPNFAWPVTTEPRTVSVASSKDSGGGEIGSASRAAFDTSYVSITGILFDDLNGNGAVDENECGIENATHAINATSGIYITQVATNGTFELRRLDQADEVRFKVDYAGRPYVGDLLYWRPTFPARSDDFCEFRATPRPRYGANIYEASVGLAQSFANGSLSGYVYEDADEDGRRGSGRAPC